MSRRLDVLLTGQQFKRLYDRKLSEVCTGYGMSRMEVDALLFLANNPGCDTAKDMVEIRFLAKSGVSKTVDCLVRRGYVEEHIDKADRRIVHLKITPAAGEAVWAAQKAQRQFFDILYEGISPEEKELMEITAEKISSNIKRSLERENAGG